MDSIPSWLIVVSFLLVLVGNFASLPITMYRLRRAYEENLENEVEDVVLQMVSNGKLPSAEAQSDIKRSVDSLQTKMDSVGEAVIALRQLEAKLSNGIVTELQVQRKLLEQLIERVSRMEGRLDAH